MKKFFLFLMACVLSTTGMLAQEVVGTAFKLTPAGGCAVEGADNYPQKYTFTGQWQSITPSVRDFAVGSRVVIEFAEPTEWDFNTPCSATKGGEVSKWQAFNSIGTGKDKWEIDATEEIFDLFIQNSQTVTTTLTISKAYYVEPGGTEEIPLTFTLGGGVSVAPVTPNPESIKATCSQQWGGVNVSNDIIGLVGKKTLRIYSNTPLTGTPIQWCIKTAEGKDAWPAIGVSATDPNYAECEITDVLSSIYLQWTSTSAGQLDIKAITWENEEPKDVPTITEKTGDLAVFSNTVAREFGGGGDKTYGADEITVVSAPAIQTNDYESQFFIVFDKAYPAGTKLEISFDGKASVATSVGTQAHGTPGNYNHWECIGDIDLGTEWQPYHKSLTISSDMAKNGGMQSIAFNLSKAEAIVYEFQNVSVTASGVALAMGNGNFEIAETIVENEYQSDYKGVTIRFADNNVATILAGEEALEYDAVALIAKEAYLYEEGNDEPIAEEHNAMESGEFDAVTLFTNASVKAGKTYNVVIPIYGLQLINQMNDECYWSNLAELKTSFKVVDGSFDVNLEITDAGWATFYAPFDVDLTMLALTSAPKAYIVESVDEDNQIVLKEVAGGSIPAYQPVLLEGDKDACEVNGKADPNAYPIAEGILMGVEEDTPACAGDYVLQKNNDVVGFYVVAPDTKVTIPAYHAFLQVPNMGPGARVQAYYLDAVTALNKLTQSTSKTIYDLNGRQLQKLQKGVNVVNGVKVLVK